MFQMSVSELNEAFGEVTSNQKVKLNNLGRLISPLCCGDSLVASLAISTGLKQRVGSLLLFLHASFISVHEGDEVFAQGMDEYEAGEEEYLEFQDAVGKEDVQAAALAFRPKE